MIAVAMVGYLTSRAIPSAPAAVPEPTAETPFVIKLGGGFFEAGAPCAALADAAYDACLAAPPG